MSDTAVVKREETEGGAFLAMLAKAASDPSIDVSKMQAIMEMCERQRARQAETAFAEAMQAAQQEMVAVTRDAENKHTGSKYARLETIDAKIRPIYTKHGFALTFGSGKAEKLGAVRIVCDVLHRAGHSKRYELEGDLDVAGSKGTANKTPIQGLGSVVSYLRRYLELMIFNLMLTNEDNDGNGSREAQDQVLKRRLAEMPPDAPHADDGEGPTHKIGYDVLQGFGAIKKEIGDENYYRILGAAGYKKSNQIPDRGTARKVYKLMANELKAMRAAEDKEPESAS